MRKLVLGLSPLALLVLAGCASQPSEGVRKTWGTVEQAPAERQQPEPPASQQTPPPARPVPIQPEPVEPPQQPKTAAEISGAAVTALLQQASSLRGSGQYDQAASALERALRIEPRNYFTWSLLAAVNLDQGHYDQAESVAERSNSLARGNVYVELQNWKTIAAAREAQADAVGAIEARDRVEQLQRRAGMGG